MQKVQWIKISTDFLDGSSFKFIKRAKIDGIADFRDKLESVWFELLALAGKVNNNGCFYNDEVDYNNISDLAIMLDREDKELELCLKFYLKHKMITVSDNTYQLENWCKFQNVQGLEKMRENNRIRQQKFRENQKIKQLSNVTVALHNKESDATHNVTLSRDLDLDLDLERDKESITTKTIVQIPTEELERHSDISEKFNEISKKKTRQVYSMDNFNKFWEIYPKKIGKPKCANWFKSHKADYNLTKLIIRSVEEHMKLEQWQDRKYIPLPFTYLNQKRWEDVLNENDYVKDMAPKPIKTKKELDADQKELDALNDADFSDVLGD